MDFFADLLSNYMLVAAIASWFAAQVIKTAIDAYFNRGINWERMTGSGGMPSSHSSCVVSMATAAAIQYGLSSSVFAVSFVLASVVMYDAMGVRRETGKQAVLLLVDHQQNDEFVKEDAASFNDVQMSQGDGIKGSRIQCF